MHTAIRFDKACPTCGRHLHIPIELYGKLVRCHGCNAEFRASGHEVQRTPLDSRVDTLLAAADRQLERSCVHAPQS